MTLSILIPTLHERRQKLFVLKQKLMMLARPYGDEIEILINEDNGEKSTGVKRNELIDLAKGRMSAFIDDDDDVPHYYFDSIFKAIRNKPEVDSTGSHTTSKTAASTAPYRVSSLCWIAIFKGVGRGAVPSPAESLKPDANGVFQKDSFP